MEFALPEKETKLDWLGNAHSVTIYHFIIKLFYFKSAFQCNSINVINGGRKYHDIKRGNNTYVYKGGLNFNAVEQFLRENINIEIPTNPLIAILKQHIDSGRGTNFWFNDPLRVDLNKFNLTEQSFNTQLLSWMANHPV